MRHTALGRWIIGAGAATAIALTAAVPASAATTGNGTESSPWDPPLTAHESCSGRHLFGNYSNGNFTDPVGDLGNGDQLDVRYVKGDAALVKWHGHAIWGFTKNDCVAY